VNKVYNMAYKYQPIKDEIFDSEDEDEIEEIQDEIEDEVLQEEESILGIEEQNSSSDATEHEVVTGRPPVHFVRSDQSKIRREVLSGSPRVIPPNSKVKQVIEQDGVLILETVEADPNDPDLLPAGSTVIASGAEGGLSVEESTDANDTSKIDMQYGGEEKEACHICGKRVMHLDKHILANHGEKVECQLCSKTFPVGNLRWHILKEHCHNKVTECSLCEQKFVTKNALKNHIKQIHLSETSTCHICHKEYKDLYHHVKYFHEKIRNYECSYCEKKFQAKKLLYNHVQSIHLGEKTNCPDCKKDISVDNFSRHVREFHEQVKKPCPHCERGFSMSNLSRHIRQVHNNESTECPDCGKALTISNLNKHIKSVHKKLKKTCDICNEEVPYSSISVHKRKVHSIGKPMDAVTPRGPNLKLRKRLKMEPTYNDDEEFNRVVAAKTYPGAKEKRAEMEEMAMEGMEGFEADDGVEEEDFGTRTIQVGDRNFTFSFA